MQATTRLDGWIDPTSRSVSVGGSLQCPLLPYHALDHVDADNIGLAMRPSMSNRAPILLSAFIGTCCTSRVRHSEHWFTDRSTYMTTEFDLFEIMRTTRSMRRLKPDPVPNALLSKILESGTYAASGGNMQQWRFLVIRDAAIKALAGTWYRKAWHEVVAPRYRSGEPAPGTSPERFSRMLAAAEHLADHIHEAPVWIVPCLKGPRQPGSGASIFPAVQNMLLAARALGLGATLTTLYLIHEKEAEEAMGIPDSHHSYAIIPVGYPLGRFGPVRRASLVDVAYDDGWGQPWTGA
jgi:nitroreductase